MVKILYVDFYCNNWGQKRMNRELISYLASFAKVDVLSQKNWYKGLSQGIDNIEMPVEMYQTGRIASRTNSLSIMIKAMKLDLSRHYDYIFAASFETFAFGFGRLLFQKPERFFIIHNNNLDTINRKIIALVFKSYANKVNHLVLEKFIGDYLIKEYGISRTRITWLPHPMNKNFSNEEKVHTCVGISNSNDEALISQIIYLERQRGFLKKSEKKVILRSKKQTYNDGFLKVITGYLEEMEYNYYINSTRAVLIPFPDTFCNRMSGTLIDALSNGTMVYGADIPVMRVFAKRYPSICHIYHDAEDLMQLICSQNKNGKQEEFEQFQKEHSPQRITEILKVLFV